MTDLRDAGSPRRADDWRSRNAHLQEVREQVRQMRREPAGSGYRAALALATAAWIAVVVWMAATLPDRVPQHWSWGTTPDQWASRTEAVATSVILPLVVCFPLLWLSRLVIAWPDSINITHKQWWLATPARLNRLERLLREDVTLMVTLLLLLMTYEDVAIIRAAHQPGGTRNPVEFWIGGALFLGVIAVWLLRRARSGRYSPHDDLD